jgi:predicted TIM-barrel fold metal-dependent hydrolase
MNAVVDAHQHFWTYGTYQTSWMEVPPKVWRETTRALAGLSRGERDRILGGTAIAFYRLPGLWKNEDAQGPSC